MDNQKAERFRRHHIATTQPIPLTTTTTMFWSAGFFSGKKTMRASSLTVGQHIKGKNGYTYKVVDLVHVSSETLITTFHELNGQESFSVKPNEPIEYIESCEGEDVPNVGVDDVVARRRATASDVASAKKGGNVLTSGKNPRRVMSEFALMAPEFTGRRGPQSRLKAENFKDSEVKRLSGNSLKNAANELMLGQNGEGVDLEEDRAESGTETRRSSGSFESYRDLVGFLDDVAANSSGSSSGEESRTEESSVTEDSGSSEAKKKMLRLRLWRLRIK